jgi:hypothetical protein
MTISMIYINLTYILIAIVKIFKPAFDTGSKRLADDGRQLFEPFWPLMFTQSHTRAAAVLVDEFDASCFPGAPNRQVVGRCH